MFSIENRAGRLLELRVAPPVVLEDLAALQTALRPAFAKRPDPMVACTDARGIHILPRPVSDAFVALMQADNPRLARSAILVGDSAVFGLQVERMLRDADNPERRSFRDITALEAWLGEVLTVSEVARLDEFLKGERRG